MTHYRVQVALQNISNLARDQVVNTIHLHSAAPINWVTEGNAVLAAFATFYDGFVTGNPLYFSCLLAINNHTFKVYDMANVPNSPPVYSRVFNFGGLISSVVAPMPPEVALCLTFHGVPRPGPGVHPQSWRGRIYLGPWNVTCLTAVTGRPLGSLRQAIPGNAVILNTALQGKGLQWCIYSKKQAMLYPVESFGCDDSWDIQRSRGDRPTGAGTLHVLTEVPLPIPA